jgi:hypothetical protein
MKPLLLALALWTAALSLALAADSPGLTTNSVTVGKQGTLQIVAPRDWRFTHTNVSGAPPYASLHSPSNSIAIEISVYWDGIGKKISKPTEADFEQIVSNVSVRSYEPTSVERKTTLEKFQGPGVTGVFARFTDARWVPVLKGDYPNVASGMFRSGNLWGNFTLLTYEKDGPSFKQGLQVLQSMRRVP